MCSWMRSGRPCPTLLGLLLLAYCTTCSVCAQQGVHSVRSWRAARQSDAGTDVGPHALAAPRTACECKQQQSCAQHGALEPPGGSEQQAVGMANKELAAAFSISQAIGRVLAYLVSHLLCWCLGFRMGTRSLLHSKAGRREAAAPPPAHAAVSTGEALNGISKGLLQPAGDDAPHSAIDDCGASCNTVSGAAHTVAAASSSNSVVHEDVLELDCALPGQALQLPCGSHSSNCEDAQMGLSCSTGGSSDSGNIRQQHHKCSDQQPELASVSSCVMQQGCNGGLGGCQQDVNALDPQRGGTLPGCNTQLPVAVAGQMIQQQQMTFMYPYQHPSAGISIHVSPDALHTCVAAIGYITRCGVALWCRWKCVGVSSERRAAGDEVVSGW